jgi:hypothetical protein
MMGTLKKMRLTMKTDRDLRKLMVRGSHNEILLDLDGDKQADIALQDINSDGNIDRFAFDATGDGWFNLFIDDEDRNGVPDRIFVVKYGKDEEPDKVVELAAGPEVEQEIIAIAQEIALLIQAKEIIGEEMIVRLNDLDRKVSKASRVIRAGMQ